LAQIEDTMERLLTYLETKVFPEGCFFNSRAKAFIERLAELAIAADGTCTGAHGSKLSGLPNRCFRFVLDWAAADVVLRSTARRAATALGDRGRLQFRCPRYRTTICRAQSSRVTSGRCFAR
jgi:hypothetical protein